VSDARDAILEALVAARPAAAPDVVRVAAPAMPTDALGFLRDRVRDAGGQLQQVAGPDGLEQIEWPVDPLTTEHVYSAWPAVASRGVGLDATTDRELESLELCVLRAEFVVVENGAVWHVPAQHRERAAALLAQHLVVVVDANEIVPSLHQAYDRIDLAEQAFGWFLCGPSKTADIEQSLVLGAHGPRTMSLVLLSEGD
jgi:L-lactate dehydrogenase complex protein LldG